MVADVCCGQFSVIQNHFLFYDQFAEPFSVQNPFSLLRDRRTTNEKGEKISEWALTIPEVEEFARTLSHACNAW